MNTRSPKESREEIKHLLPEQIETIYGQAMLVITADNGQKFYLSEYTLTNALKQIKAKNRLLGGC